MQKGVKKRGAKRRVGKQGGKNKADPIKKFTLDSSGTLNNFTPTSPAGNSRQNQNQNEGNKNKNNSNDTVIIIAITVVILLLFPSFWVSFWLPLQAGEL